MRTRNAYQLWIGGGALVAVALLALAWFFLVGPQRSETKAAKAETAAAQTRVDTLRQRLVQLEEQQRKLPEYEAQLERDRAALPANAGTPDFLRELQAAGNATGVTVSGTTIAGPSQVTTSTEKVYALPITLTAEGTAGGLDRFLDELQRVQPRAVLISAVSLTAEGDQPSFRGRLGMTVTLKAFVAPDLGGAVAPGD